MHCKANPVAIFNRNPGTCRGCCKGGGLALITRRLLRNRRSAVTMNVEHNGVHIRMTAGHYETGELGEIFLNANCASSTLDAILGDAAILASQLLQRGCTLQDIRHSLKR